MRKWACVIEHFTVVNYYYQHFDCSCQG